VLVRRGRAREDLRPEPLHEAEVVTVVPVGAPGNEATALTTERHRASVSIVAEIEINGVRLYVEERGEGDPILGIHGTGSSAMAWREAAETMSGLGRVIVYDRRGCTRSERPEPYERTNVREHAEDAAALLRTLDAAPAIVIGRSYGGETAVELALAYPELVRALVLLEAASMALDPEAQLWERALVARVEEAGERDPSSVAETFLRVVLGDEAWEGMPRRARETFTANGQAILAELRGGSFSASEEDLGRISVPTMLVAGEDSPEMFGRVTERMAAAIPGSRLDRVPGGHLIDPAGPGVLAFVRSVLDG
jgi:pimeloyl-ACP methyl ester carboxylesterase